MKLLLFFLALAPCASFGADTTTAHVVRLYSLENLLNIARRGTPDQKNDPALQKEAVRFFSEYYQGPADPRDGDLRAEVLTWIVTHRISYTASLPLFLETVAVHDRDEGTRVVAVRAMGDLGFDSNLEVLNRLVFPGAAPPFALHTSVRQEASQSLGKLAKKNPEGSVKLNVAIEQLTKAAKVAEGADGAAIDGLALCGMEKPSVMATMTEILENSRNAYSVEARIRVIQWFRHQGVIEVGAVALLQKLVSSGDSPYVRLSAAHALISARRSTRAVEQALKVLSSNRALSASAQGYARQLSEGSPPDHVGEVFPPPDFKGCLNVLALVPQGAR